MEKRMLERRWERRLLCADLVEIQWNAGGGWTRSTTALLEDISPSGGCLQTDSEIPVKAFIRIQHGRKSLEGVVTYCIYRDIGFFTGVNFTAKQKWSEKMFRPKHLVDPAQFDGSRGVAE